MADLHDEARRAEFTNDPLFTHWAFFTDDPMIKIWFFLAKITDDQTLGFSDDPMIILQVSLRYFGHPLPSLLKANPQRIARNKM